MIKASPMKAYVMVGAPGSGKSTHAGLLAERDNAFVICGDYVRAYLYGDEAVQGDWNDIQDRIEELLSEACGMSVVMDGTHYCARYRKETLSLLRSYGYDEIEAIVVNPSLETCLRQNSQRSRKVPEYVIHKMHSVLQSSLSGIGSEGFSEVRFV